MGNDDSAAVKGVRPVPLRLGWGLIAFLVAFLLGVRYLPHPWAVFVADDWANWARGLRYASHWEALRVGLTDPNRPLSMGAVELCFRLFGRNPVPWTVISIVGNSLLLLCLAKLTLELTGKRVAALAAGIVFALLPNLTETYHWSTQVLNELSCALVFYALSGWMWVAFVRRGGAWRLALSAGAYAVAVFSYEAGILLPAAYVMLLPWRKAPLTSIARLAPFALVGIAYLMWRMTDAFGLNQAWHYPPHMEAGISLWGISWNIRQLVHWWIGDNLFGAALAGLNSFATLPPWTRRGLVLFNVILIYGAYRLWRKTAGQAPAGGSPTNVSTWSVVGFGLAWTLAAMMISVISYTAPRLNVLPAIGISIVLGWLLANLPLRRIAPVLAIPVLLAMISNQGSAESFRQAGLFNVRLFEHLESTVEEWEEQQVIVFDTQSMRNRLTHGLLDPVSEAPGAWAVYNNALLFRGFVPKGMVRRALNTRQTDIIVLHDVEHGAHLQDNRLHWHSRYDPSKPRSTPMTNVYVVDVHRAAMSD